MTKSNVIYFSRPGENIYRDGKAFLNTGNTEVLAREIADQTHAVLRPLSPVVAYPISYDETLARSRNEGRNGDVAVRGTMPSLGELGEEIYLGFPLWWNTIPGVVMTFLKSVDLSGATLYPFCTHEGSRFGKALSDIAVLQPGAHIAEGLPVRGSCVTCSAQAVRNWLEDGRIMPPDMA